MANTQRKLPFSVRRRLALLRWSIRAYIALESVALVLIWIGLTFWAALAVDYLPVLAGASEMPWGARLVVLAVISTVLFWILYRWFVSRTLVRMSNDRMAILLERRFPELGDALLTIVELSQHPDHAEGFNESMLDETGRQALAAIPRIRLRHVFRMRPLLVKALLAGLIVASIATFARLEASAFDLSLRRLYLLDNTLWPRRTHLRVVGVQVTRSDLTSELIDVPPVRRFENRTLKVAKGADVRLIVEADAKKVVPEQCFVYYETDEGDSGRVTMKRIGNVKDGAQRFEFDGRPFRGILSDMVFDVRGADHRVRGYRLDVVDSPAVVKTKLACVFPDYLVNRELSLWTPRTIPLTAGLELPQGTQIRLKLQSSKPLRYADVIWPAATPRDKPRRKRIMVDSSGDGYRVELPMQVLGDRISLDVVLYDRDGVFSDRPHHIVVGGVADEPPRVAVRVRGIGAAITPQAVIPFEGTIEDDHETARAWCDVVVNQAAPRKIPVRLVDGKTVDLRVDFRELSDAEQPLKIRPKDKVTLVVRARDRYDLTEDPPVGTGARNQLDVLTPEELLARLDRRELELRRRFEQIIEEMTQMRDSLGRIVSDRAEEVPTDADAPEDKAHPPTPEELATRLRSLNVLRAQRAQSQTDKSAGEIRGVSASFEDIRLEIDHNRIDAEDRKHRIDDQIVGPLQLVVSSMFPQLSQTLEQLDAELTQGQPATATAQKSFDQAGEILIELDKVLQKMLELEDYNALVQLVRRLLEEQKELEDRTKALRKKKALDLIR